MNKKLVYISHPSSYNYVDELYNPLKKSRLNKQYKFFFPHNVERIFEAIPTDSIISTCEYFIAEVSLPSLGVGIEIGWADISKRNIIYIYRKGTNLSYSLGFIHNVIYIEYLTNEDLIIKLEEYLL